MDKNIFLEIEYDGTNYFGFQIQNKKQKKEETIQGALEKTLEKLFNEKIRVVYTGRTDRGVHAYAQGVNFKVDTCVPLKTIQKVLNDFLPTDIQIKKVKNVSADFHSRFSAISKTYRYIISSKKELPVFNRNFCWHIAEPLDLDKMKTVSKKLGGNNDFSIFATEVKRYKTCVRQVKGIIIRKTAGNIYIDIEADGFLRSMVRNIVLFLVQIGLQKISLKQANDILERKIPYSKKPAPAAGLYLLKVNYRW
ncbi:MAG: tRNA pseudouridine(38-40) synthase TruA [Candidatus Omnitrophota bacterium]|nr:tRNA pseudouridine(38-40) synthase TruA [Candidatus Omnitrophota bacterium]